MALSPGSLKVLFFATLALFYAAAIHHARFPFFPLEGDETHFWVTSESFSHAPLPPVAAMQDYNDLNTPLPFIIFGELDYYSGNKTTHGLAWGIVLGRALNLLASLAVVLIIAFAGGKLTVRSALSAAGLFLGCIYFLGVCTHLYTDPLAILFALTGVALYARNQLTLSMVAFMVGIAARQYVVAMPAAIAGYEFLTGLQTRTLFRLRWVFPGLAAATILGWFVFFGMSFGPQLAVHNQHIATSHAGALLWRNSLYFLTALGVYFVIPEAVLGIVERVLSARKPAVARGLSAGGYSFGVRWAAAGVLLAIPFYLVPPVMNVWACNVQTMGFFDIAVRKVLHDAPVMGLVTAVDSAAKTLELPFGTADRVGVGNGFAIYHVNERIALAKVTQVQEHTLTARYRTLDGAADPAADDLPLLTTLRRPTQMRMVLYWVLASAALARFAQMDLTFALVLVNALIMAKAHIAWEKYTLPLLACLWYLRALEFKVPAVAGMPWMRAYEASERERVAG